MKINQISLDESGEHVGICSEDGKVRPRSAHRPRLLILGAVWGEIANQCFQSFHNSSSDLKDEKKKTQLLLISVELYANHVELDLFS